MQLVSSARVLFWGWLEVRGLRRRFGRGEVVWLGLCWEAWLEAVRICLGVAERAAKKEVIGKSEEVGERVTRSV